jgi:glyoxylase-like metal-dependent hydrolase (beta-lactamase superfamily II)
MLYFRQLRCGREIARANSAAGQMANFVYLIGDRETRECVIVDPAWDVRGAIDEAAKDDMKVTGALVTHYHPDHVGGEIFGISIEGLPRLLELAPGKIYVNRQEAEGVRQVAGLSATDLTPVDGGDSIKVGGTEIRFIHTPGHTPGSQCFLVDANTLVSGDTLFIGGCGRVDLPGADPEQMYQSLTQKLAKLGDDVVLYPGHDYADKPKSTLGEEKASNYYLRVPTLEAWMRLMGQSG